MHHLIVLSLFAPFLSIAQSKGALIFKSNCASCHTISKGNLVGPDLEGLLERRNKNWLRKFIQSSQTLIAEGDTLALTLFQENNYVPMPDQLLSDDDLTAVLNYIDQPIGETSIVQKEVIQEISGKKEKKGNSKTAIFERFVKRPINWLISFSLLVIVAGMYTLLRVITVLAEYNIRKRDEYQK
jgi:cytochrome c2